MLPCISCTVRTIDSISDILMDCSCVRGQNDKIVFICLDVYVLPFVLHNTRKILHCATFVSVILLKINLSRSAWTDNLPVTTDKYMGYVTLPLNYQRLKCNHLTIRASGLLWWKASAIAVLHCWLFSCLVNLRPPHLSSGMYLFQSLPYLSLLQLTPLGSFEQARLLTAVVTLRIDLILLSSSVHRALTRLDRNCIFT